VEAERAARTREYPHTKERLPRPQAGADPGNVISGATRHSRP
jgi:hypothetical protein